METIYICPTCQKEFIDNKKLQNHIKWHKGFEKYNIQKMNETTIANEKTKQKRRFICERCNKEYIKILSDKEYENFLKCHTHFYCSRSCANSRRMSPEIKEKISKSISEKYLKIYICKICKSEYYFTKGISTKTFCSKECSEYYKSHRKQFLSKETIEKYRECGKRVANYFKDIKRSKNEIEFYELCKSSYADTIHNEPIFNGWDADIIIPSLRIAILWNGKWHYEKLTEKHSVEQVQNRDKIKINEIEKCGYFPYVIKDLGKYSKRKVREEFENFKNFLENKFTLE